MTQPQRKDNEQEQEIVQELISIENLNPAALFKEGGLDAVLKEVDEKAEKDREEIIERQIDALTETTDFQDIEPDIKQIQDRLDTLELFYGNFTGEGKFAERAEYIYGRAKINLNGLLESRVKFEADHAELEKLRKESAERDKKDNEERIKKEAADAAKKEAEDKARTERESSEKAAADSLAAEEAKTARMKSEKEEAEKKIKDAEEAKIAAKKKALADKNAAVQAEKDRVAAEKLKEKEATDAREANKKHRAKINNESKDAIWNIVCVSTTDNMAENIIKAIAKGEIPHIKITY